MFDLFADDQWFCSNPKKWFPLDEIKAEVDWDGLIPCSVEPGNSWSFCVVEESKEQIRPVTRVTEKNRVSEWCSVGAYWFRDSSILRECTRLELSVQTIDGEFYVAPIYNRLIEQRLRIGMLPTQVFRPMGSIEQIETYWGLSLEEFRSQNAV